MASAPNSLNRTSSDAVDEAKSYHILLETFPPDYVKKVSQYLESSAEHKRLDKACDEPAQALSDSGDNLFITQKPVPEPVTGTRLCYDPIVPEERKVDTSCSASLRISTANEKKKFTQPKHAFPFLKEKKRKHRSAFLPVLQNTRLNNAMMGGFFKCVREVWQGYESGNMELSLPTVDTDGKDIYPLSEKEDERSDEEDIRIVKNKCFLAPSKAKCSQPWYTPAKTDDQVNQQRNRRRKSSDTSQDMSQESQQKMPFELSAKASVTRATVLFSDTDNCATVCEPLQLQGNTEDLSWSEQEEEDNGSQSLLQSLPQFLDYTNNDSVRAESMAKKKKNKKAKGDHGRVEEGRGQSPEEPEGLHAAASVNVDPEETFSLPKNSSAKPVALQTCDELELSENYIESSPHSTQIKRKRKKRKFTAENVGQGVGDNLESGVTEDSEFSVMCNIENADQVKKKKKKKKKKISVEDDECVEQLHSRAVTETLNDDVETLEKMKNETSITGEEKEEDLENNGFSLETLGSNYEKKRSKRKKKKLSSSLDDTEIGEDVAKVSSSNEGVTFEENTGLSVKKRKTKKRRESICEGVDISYSPGKSERGVYIDNSHTTIDGSEDQDAEHVTKKKKKREKIADTSKREVPEDTAAQSSICAVYVWKKEQNRTSSFLDAYSEEHVAQPLQQQQRSCLKSVAAPVWGVEKVFGHVEADSAEITGNSGDGVRKKKKKRRRRTSATQDSAEDHGPDFEELNKTEVF